MTTQTTHTPGVMLTRKGVSVYSCGCIAKDKGREIIWCRTHAQAPAMLERFAERARQFHEAKHGTFWPMFEECNVEQCINDRAILRAIEGRG